MNELPKYSLSPNRFDVDYFLEYCKDKALTFKELIELIPHFSFKTVIDEHHNGRKKKYSEELAIQFCILLFEYKSIYPVLAKLSVNRTTIWKWRRLYIEFDNMFRFTMNCIFIKEEKKPYSQHYKKQQKIHTNASPKKKGTTGAQTKYKPEYNRFVKSSLSKTAKTLGVSKRTIVTWCNKYPEFKMAQTIKSVERALQLLCIEVDKQERVYSAFLKYSKLREEFTAHE